MVLRRNIIKEINVLYSWGLFTNRLKGPSKPITELSAPTQFNTKLNEFFEDFLNPLLTIKLDVSGQIPVETERVYVERFILNNEDPTTVDKFEETYKSSSEINYAKFNTDLIDLGLLYYIDSEVIEMPIRTVQYTGTFDVTKISNEQRSQVVDGVTQTRTIKLFTLNKLSYSDSTRELKDTEILKINDSPGLSTAAGLRSDHPNILVPSTAMMRSLS